MEPLAVEAVESPRLQLRGLPLENRLTSRLTADRFIDRRGSTSDALLDFRSPRFESLETVRRANLRIERRQSLLPASTDPLDLHTPREDMSMSTSGTRSDVRLDEPQSAPLMGRRSTTTASSPLAMAISRRETMRKSPRGEPEAVKGLEKEVQKFAEQEDERRYKRALSVLESGLDESFAMLPSTPEAKKERKEKGGKKRGGGADSTAGGQSTPSFSITRAMLTDFLWTAGAFTVAVALGLLLLRIELAIRALAHRQNPVGKVLRALWAWMFASARAKVQPRR